MTPAEMALAERTLVSGMGPALLNTAKTHPVSLCDASPVFQVRADIVPLRPARLARTHGFVILNVSAVFGAKVAPAVLTNLN